MIKIDEFLDLVKKRRSIRRFKSDPIPGKLVEKIIEVARWAMSGANAQPWEFVVVKDQNKKIGWPNPIWRSEKSSILLKKLM